MLPDDPHRDLFYGFPNSYGSLGYALRIEIELEPVRPFVELRHVSFPSAAAMAEAIVRLVDAREYEGLTIDFIDGTVFSPTEQYLTLGFMVDEVPDGLTVSDYTGMDIYYRSIQRSDRDCLTIHDYLWRWDTDWFWCSKNFGAQHPLVRRLLGRSRLNSRTYTRWMRWNDRLGISRQLARLRGRQLESVIQDVDIPIASATNHDHLLKRLLMDQSFPPR